MIRPAEVSYLKRQLDRHIRLHFHPDAAAAYNNAKVLWVDWNKIGQVGEVECGTLIIPVLESSTEVSHDTWEIDFRGTKLVFWGGLPAPNDSWQVDDTKKSLWYSNEQGAFLAAWNLVGILLDLLTLKEEISSLQRDKHGRFVGEMSPRCKDDLLTVPIFNNAAAVLVDRCLSDQAPSTYRNKPFAKPINLCLSHDLDQLRGDDFWTQLSRVGRMIAPMARLKMPNLSQLKFIIVNALYPRKSFMDDLLEMIEVEKEFGFRSIQYVLCGRKGRYGARTSTKYYRQYLNEIPADWPIGIHYNYDTHLHDKQFRAQKNEVESITGTSITAGRAHYLRMEPKSSFSFWSKMGIQIDESLGYPDKVGYRAGIAGPFHPYDTKAQEELPILSLPLVTMDSCIGDNLGAEAIEKIEEHVAHLSVVGGTFTLLFHPGRFDNAEFPKTQLMYRQLLELFHRYGANCLVPSELRQ